MLSDRISKHCLLDPYCQITFLCSLNSDFYLQIAPFLITWSSFALVSLPVKFWVSLVQFAIPRVFLILLRLRVMKEKKANMNQTQGMEM